MQVSCAGGPVIQGRAVTRETPSRIALWWTTETLFLCACGCILVMFLERMPALSALLVLFFVWFTFSHMHAGLDLEWRALKGEVTRELFTQRKFLLIRLALFYFSLLTYGILLVGWYLSGRPNELDGDFVPTMSLMALAVFRILCLQRRYLRLRGDELSLER